MAVSEHQCISNGKKNLDEKTQVSIFQAFSTITLKMSLNCQWGQIFVCTKPLKKYFGYNMIPFDAYYAETFIELSVGTDLCLHKTTQKVFWIQYDHI